MNQPQAFTAAEAAFSFPLFHISPLSHHLSNDGRQTLTGNVLLAPGAFLTKVIEPEAVAQFMAMAWLFDALYLLEKGV